MQSCLERGNAVSGTNDQLYASNRVGLADYCFQKELCVLSSGNRLLALDCLDEHSVELLVPEAVCWTRRHCLVLY